MTLSNEPVPRFRYYLNLGSNMGDSKLFIETAIRHISDMFGKVILSEMVGSEPWGFDSANRFLNVGVAVESSMPPEKMLLSLQTIEKRISITHHRNSDGSYRDREIDIDIMTAWEVGKEEIRIETPTLTLPHIHLTERDFFLKPLEELYHKVPPQ